LMEWSQEAVNACSLRQKRIVADIMECLKPGGHLLYSTCSYSREENEDIVQWMQAEFGLEHIPIPATVDSGIIDSGLGLRFYPHKVKSEGFFCSLLRKNEDENSTSRKRELKTRKANKSEAWMQEMLTNEGLEFRTINGGAHCMNQKVADFFSACQGDLFFRKAGVRMGELKGKDFVPDAQLAWFTDLSQKFERVELDHDKALKFLRKEPFALSGNVKGFALMCYKGYGLGWAKILPNRINNYYPNELRILK